MNLLVILDCNLLLLDGLSFLDSRITTCDGFLINLQSRCALIYYRILLPISRSLSPSVPMLRLSLICCRRELKCRSQIFSSHRLRSLGLLIACVRQSWLIIIRALCRWLLRAWHCFTQHHKISTQNRNAHAARILSLLKEFFVHIPHVRLAELVPLNDPATVEALAAR